MPPFYSWILRLLLLVSLCILAVILKAIWPDFRSFQWIDLAGVAALGVATVGIGVWTFSEWLPGDRSF